MSTITDRTTASYIRKILRDQMSSSYMDRKIVRRIFDDGLIRHTEWPSSVMTLSEKGAEFLREVEADNASA